MSRAERWYRACQAMRAMRRFALIAASLVVFSPLACSSSNGAFPASGGGGDDSGAPAVDGAADAGPPSCASGGATPDMSCGTLAWTTSAVTSRPRNHHVTALTTSAAGASSLVAMGGIDGMSATSLLANVDVAPLAADGSLGAWAAGPDLPAASAGATGENVGGVLVFAGGQGHGGFSKAVYTSVVGADGSLGAWQAVAPLPQPRMHAGSFAHGARIYVLGGFAALSPTPPSTVWDDVVAADVGHDGSIAAWTSVAKLPTTWTHMSVSEADGYVFLAGGLHGDPFGDASLVADVTRARIADDGTLVEWTPQTSLPLGVATHASLVYGGYLYVVGGVDDLGSPLADVRRAPIQDHTLGKWQLVAALPVARAHVHQLPMLPLDAVAGGAGGGPRVYSVAGAIDTNLDSTTVVALGAFQ
jgi:hypothetical protein